MFAPNYHSAMKYVGSVRKKIGKRTIFNIQLVAMKSSSRLHRCGSRPLPSLRAFFCLSNRNSVGRWHSAAHLVKAHALSCARSFCSVPGSPHSSCSPLQPQAKSFPTACLTETNSWSWRLCWRSRHTPRHTSPAAFVQAAVAFASTASFWPPTELFGSCSVSLLPLSGSLQPALTG